MDFVISGVIMITKTKDIPGIPVQDLELLMASLNLSVIQSNFGNPSNLELIGRIENKLLHYCRDSGPSFQWNGPFEIIADNMGITEAAGNPVLIQSKFG